MAQILVVDDVPSNVTMLTALLRDEHQVKVATGGEHALLLCATDPQPDLVLLDVDMPGMNGFEVCTKLKEDADTRGIPVIFVTGLDAQADQEKGFELGAVDYITKPYMPALVKARVHLHLRLALHQKLLERLVERSGAKVVLSAADMELVRKLQALRT